MRIVAGTARGRTIEAPEGKNTRPTLDRVRENLFNVIQNDIRGSRVLDLFAGSGALSLEAISRGAERAVLVDHDRAAIACIRKNIEKLGFGDKTKVLQADWHAALIQLKQEKFDLVFLDPPYMMLDLKECTEMILPMLSEDALLIIEHQANTMPFVSDGYDLTDNRRWGIAGVTMFRPCGKAE